MRKEFEQILQKEYTDRVNKVIENNMKFSAGMNYILIGVTKTLTRTLEYISKLLDEKGL